jgi:arginyl-tRNA synthetase
MKGNFVGTIQKEVEEIFKSALAKAFPGVEELTPMIVANKPRDQKFGDYQCNNAMKLFNQLKGQVSLPSPSG